MEEYIVYTERQAYQKVKFIRTDNGGEYVNKDVSKLLKSHDIKHQRAGVVESAHRKIVKRARDFLFQVNLPREYGVEPLNTPVYLFTGQLQRQQKQHLNCYGQV